MRDGNVQMRRAVTSRTSTDMPVPDPWRYVALPIGESHDGADYAKGRAPI